MRSTLLLSGVLLLFPLLPAQTAAAAADQQPQILIDTVGPDGWRMRFAPTNLGSLLESEHGRELWEPHLAPYFTLWEQLAGDDAAYTASRTRLLEYGGRIRMAMWLDPNERRGGDPAACIAVVLDGDGRSDLAGIAADLKTMLYQTIPGEWAEIEVDGKSYTVRRDADASITEPLLEGGRILIAASDEGAIEVALRRTRALAEAATERLPPDSPAMRVQFDFAAILAAALANESEEDRRMMQVLGLDTVGTGIATIGTAGPRVQVEYAQTFTMKDRGLFSAFLPATKSVPSLLRAVGEGTWTVGHFDCLKFYETVMDAIAAGKVTDGDPRTEVKEEMGIDPAADLLAHMTDDVMFWMPEAENFDEGIDRTAWALTFRLRDEARFRDGLFAILPQARPFLQRETKEAYEDVELFRYGNMLGYDLWLAVGRGVFVLAGGRGADERVGEVLDRCKDLPAALAADQAVPAGFDALERYLPPGCHGYGVGSATNIISLPTSLWLEILGDFTPMPRGGIEIDPDEDAERREQLSALLQAHHLDVARSATGFADSTWRMRVYW